MLPGGASGAGRPGATRPANPLKIGLLVARRRVDLAIYRTPAATRYTFWMMLQLVISPKTA
eukprot:360578-Chlamydomonas_euryale.AAC.7